MTLCERPGCSAPAAVAYGMHVEHLLVWLEIVPDGVTPIRVGMLCRRHADAMVVPRGWTLDDRRESKPRLFRVADAATTDHPSRGRTRPKPRPAAAEPAPQFSFGEAEEAEAVEAVGAMEVVDDGVTVGDIHPPAEPYPDETHAMPWHPVFDQSDDLGGVLRASSPLLSRAFRGRDAPPRSTESTSAGPEP